MKHYNRGIFIATVMTFMLFSLASYISLVIFALYISNKVGFFLTSLIVALPNIIRFFSGLLTPKIEKKFGQMQSLFLSVCIMSICYILYTIFDGWNGLMVVAILNGLAELIYQPIIKCMFAKSARDENGIEFVHRMRYLVICAAGFCGPLFGGWLSASQGYEACLYLSSALYAIACVPIFFMSKGNRDIHSENPLNEEEKKSFEIVNNKRLWAYIISGTIIFIVFSQFESVYSLALDTVFQNPAFIYSLLLSLNSLFGICLQIYSITRNKRGKRNYTMKQGIASFQIGFALFALAFSLGVKGLPFFVLGVFIYSVGEVVAIPGLDVQIDMIAPAEMKSVYFSLAEFRTIGFVLGPIIMSWMLEKTSAVHSCIFSIVLLAGACMINVLAEWYPKRER